MNGHYYAPIHETSLKWFSGWKTSWTPQNHMEERWIKHLKYSRFTKSGWRNRPVASPQNHFLPRHTLISGKWNLTTWKFESNYCRFLRIWEKFKSELAGPQNHSYWFVWQTHGKTLRLHLQIPRFMVQIPILSHKTQKLPYLGFYLERDWTCWWARWAGLGADLGALGALGWGVGFGRAGLGVGFGSGGRAGLGWARLLWICFDLIDLLALFGVYAGIIFKATSMTLVQASANYA